MPRKKLQEKVFNSEDSQSDKQKEQLGSSTARRDYITLKKNKAKPLAPNQQNQKAVELFRNEQLFKYLSEFDQEDKNNKKKTKTKSSGNDPKTQIFNQIVFNLSHGWNVCLTGGMDKMEIMDNIVEFLSDKEENIFVINGFAQPLNEKKIYNAFGTHLIRSAFTKTIDSVLIKDQLEEYNQILSQTTEDTLIYVVFYDLSNYAFLTSELQQKLAQLFSLPRVRMIASIQSCKIVLNWSFSTIQMYNFIFVNCNASCLPITKLLRHLPLPNEKSQKTELQIIQIWKSLNRNQRQIATILAQNQLTNLTSSASEQNYLSFHQLLDACIDKVILSDDHQLRENLIELTDHRVVIEEIDKTKNKKVFIMKLDRRILENIIAGKYDNYDYQNDVK